MTSPIFDPWEQEEILYAPNAQAKLLAAFQHAMTYVQDTVVVDGPMGEEDLSSLAAVMCDWAEQEGMF